MRLLAWLAGILAGGLPGLAGRFAGMAGGVPGRLARFAGGVAGFDGGLTRYAGFVGISYYRQVVVAIHSVIKQLLQ